MNEKPILIDSGGNGRIAVRWKNKAGIGERPRLVAVEWRPKTKEDRRPRRSREDYMMEIDAGKKRIKRGLVQGSLL